MDSGSLKKALLLAGGKGTRLNALTNGELPKPMVEIGGKPLILHAIERLKEYGIDELYLSVGYMREKIIDYFGNGSKFGVVIKYIIENEPLGSGGAMYYLKGEVKEPFLICPADVVFDLDFNKMSAYHFVKGSLITLFAHPNSHPYDSDLIETDDEGKDIGIVKKNVERTSFYRNLTNAGIFIVSPEALGYFTEPKFTNIEHDFLTHFIPSGKVFCYRSPEYVKDVGTPERFFSAEKDLFSGKVAARNLKNKQKAIFLDRDGTLNVYKGFIKNAEDIELLPNVTEAIKLINESGYLAIIISNQPVVARGDCSYKDVDECFFKIETLLGKEGAFIDGIYYCPHHPDSGFEGERKELKFECDCRKPKIGLIKRAEKDFNLDLQKCAIGGDSNVDVLTGKNAAIKTVLLTTGKKEEIASSPDIITDDILKAVKQLVGV